MIRFRRVHSQVKFNYVRISVAITLQHTLSPRHRILFNPACTALRYPIQFCINLTTFLHHQCVSIRMHVPHSFCQQTSRSGDSDLVTEKQSLVQNSALSNSQPNDRAGVDKPTSTLRLLSAWAERPQLFLLPAPKTFCSSHAIKPTDLPDEILLSIFQYLTCVRDVAAIRGVCRAWRRLVDHTATIWRSLVFDLPRRPTTLYHAESWYRKAADFGNAQAQVSFLFVFFLLFMYIVPQPVVQNVMTSHVISLAVLES